MPWDIRKTADDTWVIMDGNRVCGSIVDHGSTFRVEVPWSGKGGDIVHSAPTLGHAGAFVHGVEAMFERVIPGKPEVVTPI
jgi:hypothetical protein